MTATRAQRLEAAWDAIERREIDHCNARKQMLDERPMSPVEPRGPQLFTVDDMCQLEARVAATAFAAGWMSAIAEQKAASQSQAQAGDWIDVAFLVAFAAAMLGMLAV